MRGVLTRIGTQFESGAALLYLPDRYDLGAGLEDEDGMQMPHAVAAARRGRAAAWVLFANSTVRAMRHAAGDRALHSGSLSWPVRCCLP